MTNRGKIFGWCGRQSLRAKLAAAFTALIVLMLLIGGVSFLGLLRSSTEIRGYVDKDDRIADLSLRSSTAMLKARRNEKDFMLKVGDLGFYEARSRYATLVRSQMNDIRKDMAAVRTLSDDRDTAMVTDKIVRITDQYEAGFMKVVELNGRLGRGDTGLEGRFRDKAREMETIVNQSRSERLMNDLLAIRSEEKDYLLRGRDRYVEAVGEKVEKFRKDAAASAVTPSRKGKLVGLAGEYQGLFLEYVGVKAEIFTEMDAYLAAVHTIEPMLENLHDRAELTAFITRDNIQGLVRTTGVIIIATCLSAVLLGMLVALLLSLSVTRSVRRCMDFAGRIAKGDLGSTMAPEGGSEFRALALALNSMSDALHHSRLIEDERTVELAQANSALQSEIIEHERDEVEIQRLNADLEQKVEERTQELMKAQEELLRREKLNLLGIVAGNVGNELRNPLGVMSNAVFFLESQLTEADETIREYLVIIKNEIAGSQRVLSDFIDYFRTGTPRVKAVPVDELINRSLSGCAVPDNVTVSVVFPETPPMVKVDPSQMRQVLQNLITNALQAMPDGGALNIGAHSIDNAVMISNGSPLSGSRTVPPWQGNAGFVELRVADSGAGIALENMEQVFQPLFTTKARGIGLGLSICKSFVEANCGRIEVASEFGKGTCFTVQLPVSASV